MENHVRAARCSMGITIRGLHQLTGISPSFIHYIETGQKKPSVYHAVRLAEALHTSVEQLFPIQP